MKLVMVETPAQAKLLTGILGEGWRVEPGYGPVRDLPDDSLGIDTDADFRPTFVIPRGKGTLVRRLMRSIRASEAVYMALPPGRAGEMMAWHLLALSPDTKDKPIYRVSLLALTPEAIRAAFASPRRLNPNWIDAELTHRIVDRLVGYGVKSGTAPGSKTALRYDGIIALRLLVERDRAIAASAPDSRWNVSVGFEVAGAAFTARMLNTQGTPLALRSADQVAQVEALLKAATFRVDTVIQDIQPSRAPRTLTASVLMERAGQELDLSPDRTLALAEILYEAGWISYPLTDSDALSPEVVETARNYIRRTYGSEYLPSEPNERGGITPTDVNRVPEDLPGHGATLYRLIWRHCIAAQMSPALQRVAAARLLAESASGKPYPIQLRAEGRMRLFDGWQQVFGGNTPDTPLPALTEGMTLQAAQVQIDAQGPTPPVRYRPHTLVNALSRVGVAIPAAARAVESLFTTGYVAEEDGVLALTPPGRQVADALAARFDDLSSIEYRVQLSADMERIAAGTLSRDDVLRAFWTRFGGTLRLPETGSIVGAHQPVVLRPAREV